MNQPNVVTPPKEKPRRTFTPTGKYVSVYLYHQDVESGIILPQTAGGQGLETSTYLVLACGPDVKACKPGDEIMTKEIAVGIQHNRQMSGLVHEDHVIGVVDEEERKETREEAMRRGGQPSGKTVH
jgi:hypothetical protein